MDALRVWFTHPILGCGLGGFLQTQAVSFEQISKYEVFYTSINPNISKIPPTNNDAIIIYRKPPNCYVYILKSRDWLRDENGDIRSIACYPVNYFQSPIGLNGIVKDNNPTVEMRKFILEILSNSRIAPVSIHNTALWLLTETGIIGLLLFTFFVVYAIRKILTASNKYDELILGGTAVLILFVLASLTTEVMYQRHLWFIAGLTLASLKNKNLVLTMPSHGLGMDFLSRLRLGQIIKNS